MIEFISGFVLTILAGVLLMVTVAYYEQKTQVLKLKNERQKEHIKTMQLAIDRRNSEIELLRSTVNKPVGDLIAWSVNKFSENIALHADLVDAIRYTEELEGLIKELEAKTNE